MINQLKKIEILTFIILLFGSFTCRSKVKSTWFKNENYGIQISSKQKGILILFPCYFCDIEKTREEAQFLMGIDDRGVTTIILNYNQRLFISEEEKEKLRIQIDTIFQFHHLKNDPIYMDGFSSGGNIALLQCDYMSTHGSRNVKAVFSVDAPLDLKQLFLNCQNDIKLNANDVAIQEANYLTIVLKNTLGDPMENDSMYTVFSPFTYSQNSHTGLHRLNDYRIRIYTEPSPEWHKINRSRDYNYTNSRMNERFFEYLHTLDIQSCDIVKSANKGKRANGDINPHSWSLVEQDSLISWMKLSD